MKSKTFSILQVFLWGVCAFHVIVGIGLNVSASFPQTVAEYYGAQVAWTPELLYIVKPVGAFMLALGALAGVAARDPLAHRAIVYGFVMLFTMRGLQRIVFQNEIGTALGIESGRNIGNALVFLLMAAALVFLLRAVGRSAGATT
ncbi:MAG: hypothetical protein OEM25_01980 [Gammaproteobacteria bacterium]|nr:hypothetical protein [Gammaproteobacteria bacterium]